MVLKFSEEEKKYLITEKGNWQIKENCPQNIKKELERKLSLLNSQYAGVNDGDQSNG